MLELDGRTLEGGGQLVRNTLALSALTGRPVRIDRIRGGRTGSQGLRGSHTAAVKFLLEVCGGTAVGAHIGSPQITFFPGGTEAGLESEGHTTNSDIDGTSQMIGKLHLSPLGPKAPPVKPEYNIRQKTPGSIFLIFQALYPYLIYAGSFSDVDESSIRLNVTGGTNLTSAPTYDYFSQVLIPNFAKLGLPEISVKLNKRGWSFGPVEIGSVSLKIRPLPLEAEKNASADENTMAQSPPEFNPGVPRFPVINLDCYDPGIITTVDITVLAPDTPLEQLGDYERERRARTQRRKKPKNRRDKGTDDDICGTYRAAFPTYLNDNAPSPTGTNNGDSTAITSPTTLRGHIEHLALRAVSQALRNMSEFPSQTHKDNEETRRQSVSSGETEEQALPVPQVKIHTTESTHDLQHTYILLVAQTSTGFRLGRDALYADVSDKSKGRGSKQNKKSARSERHNKKPNTDTDDDAFDRIQSMVDRSVANLLSELDGLRPKSCVDTYMRDQLVVFEALGKLDEEADGAVDGGLQNNMDVSLHTRTAAWVCEKLLGVRV